MLLFLGRYRYRLFTIVVPHQHWRVIFVLTYPFFLFSNGVESDFLPFTRQCKVSFTFSLVSPASKSDATGWRIMICLVHKTPIVGMTVVSNRRIPLVRASITIRAIERNDTYHAPQWPVWQEERETTHSTSLKISRLSAIHAWLRGDLREIIPPRIFCF